MKVEIIYTEDPNYDWEAVEWRVGEESGKVYTSYSCPEDNCVSRLGIRKQFAHLALALGAVVEVRRGEVEDD